MNTINGHPFSSSILQRTAILLLLCLVILFQGFPTLGKIWWFVLALLCGINSDYAVYAVFFLCVFFTPTGFFPKVFFTIKHFHIAMAFLTISYLLKGNLFHLVKKNVRLGWPFIMWILIVLISTISGISSEEYDWVFRKNMNVISLVISSLILICVMRGRRELILNALLFFTFGVCLRVILAAFTSFHSLPLFYPAEQLIYNNHIGFLTSSAIFLLFPFFLTKQEVEKRIVCCSMLIVIFAGLLLSCSRTGWFSFLITYSISSFLLLKQAGDLPKFSSHIRWFLLITLLIFVAVVIFGVFVSPETLKRLVALRSLVDLNYLKHTLNDQQNFGFLGFYRLNQLSVVSDILKQHLFFGAGFSHQVTDFHSLYLTLLGGTGVIGLMLFIVFCLIWGKMLLSKMFRNEDDLNLFRIAVFSAFLIWITYSLMETFFLQFHIWTLLTIGILLHDRKELEADAQRQHDKL